MKCMSLLCLHDATDYLFEEQSKFNLLIKTRSVSFVATKGLRQEDHRLPKLPFMMNFLPTPA